MAPRQTEARHESRAPARHIKLHSHPTGRKSVAPVRWGAAGPAERGPVVGTLTPQRNAIGAHSGSYSLYRALAVAAGTLDPVHVPDLTDTAPAAAVGPHRQSVVEMAKLRVAFAEA